MNRDHFLFVHFTGESEIGEQIYFSLSKDGYHWNDINNGNPVLVSEIGEKGLRDPFLIRDEKNNCFYIIATDLRIASGKGWGVAQFSGSRDIIVFKSNDLISWSKPWNVTVGVEGAGCVWAPEAIFDEEKQSFMVFWASMTKFEGDKEAKQRIFASYTNDFVNFTEPFLYIERENHVIDTDIIRVKDGYVRYSKDETTKNIRADFGKTLDKDGFKPIKSDVLDNLFGVEGPIAVQLSEGKWCLFADRFAKGLGYLPLVTDNPLSGEFKILSDEEFNLGKNLKRHGGILPITKEEYDLLIERF